LVCIGDFSFVVLCSGKRNRFSLAYVTGRHLGSALSGIESYRLPVPDVFVCEVGTRIFIRDGALWKADEDFDKLMAKDWLGLDSSDIEILLKGISEICNAA